MSNSPPIEFILLNVIAQVRENPVFESLSGPQLVEGTTTIVETFLKELSNQDFPDEFLDMIALSGWGKKSTFFQRDDVFDHSYMDVIRVIRECDANGDFNGISSIQLTHGVRFGSMAIQSSYNISDSEILYLRHCDHPLASLSKLNGRTMKLLTERHKGI